MRRFLSFWPGKFRKNKIKQPVTDLFNPEVKSTSLVLSPEHEVIRFLEQEVKREDLIELMLPGLFRERRERIVTITTELAGIRVELETLYRRREETLNLARVSGDLDHQAIKLEGEI